MSEVDGGGRREGLRPSGGFVWRTPLLPVEEFFAWGQALSAPGAVQARSDELEGAVAADRATLRARLATVFDRPELREALYVASPRLEQATDVWLADPTSKRGQGVERGLVRYLTRMATRPTPFGLFAGVSTGTVGEHTRLSLVGRDAYRRRSQLDTDVLVAVADHLAGDPALWDHVDLRPNDSLYHVAGQFRYVQARQEGAGRSYRLASLPDRPAVRRMLERAESGATVGELTAALVADGHAAEPARRVVERLIARQVLVADLGVVVTGSEPLRAFVDELARHEPARPVAERLADISEALATIDAVDVGVAPERYRTIAKAVGDLPGEPAFEDPFHVVLAKPAAQASLGPRVIAALERAVDILHAQARPPESGPLATFRDAVTQRYDTREVPLVEALDGEAGVGYGGSAHPTPLLRDVPFPGEATDERWTARDELLVEWVTDAVGRGAEEITLTDADVAALRAAGDSPPLPQALAVVATLMAASGDAVDRGDFRLAVEGTTGPSGARLLGRFCHADAGVHRIVEAHLRAEEAADPQARYAEIVHLPGGREGNVVLRPVLREAEIPYLGRSGAADEAHMPVTDLRVSVREGRVVLRSQRLGCRVEPRLTSAHNAQRRSLPLYRFLFDLQQQGAAGDLAWDWGPIRAAWFRPRVTSGNLVLAPASWRVRAGELAHLHDLADGARFGALQRWREQRGLPDVVCVAQGDQRLVVDFRNVLAIDSFLHLMRRHAAPDQPVLVHETFLAADALVVEGPEGRFAHELVVPFVRPARDQPAVEPPSAPAAAPTTPVTRRFPPGSSWLYAKLYAGPASADAVLSQVVAPLRRELRATGSLAGWFFVRFGEPDWHLRVRVHGDPAWLTGEALPALQQAAAPWLADGRLWRVQLDTYEREVEALGGPDAIGHVERVFEADSDAVADLVPTLPRGDAGLDARWRLALLGMHWALGDLGMDLEERRALLTELRTGYAREHRADAATHRELGRRFRQERAALDALIAPDPEPPAALAPGVAALAQRSTTWADHIGRLRTLDRRRQLTVSWPQLAERVLHLHANRLLRFAHRRQEYVLYDFLARLYDSHAARGEHR